MRKKVPKAIYGAPDRPLRIGSDIEIPCYVLEDGKRVLVMTGMIKALDMKPGTAAKKEIGDRLTKFISTKGIKPNISEGLADMIKNPIKFKPPTGGNAYGYEATILADICDAVLAARKEDKLHWQQEHIAVQCEILIRGFARVGIIALVDEATGYQEIRDRDELHRILELYIAKELLPWARRFPDEFYRQLFRLRGWQYSPLSVKRPQYVGKLTNELIYERLPSGVLDELRKKNPVVRSGYRRHRHHQFLTENIGNPHLEKQIVAVITLMRAASNWRNFKSLFEKAFGQEQFEMPFMEESEREI